MQDCALQCEQLVRSHSGCVKRHWLKLAELSWGRLTQQSEQLWEGTRPALCAPQVTCKPFLTAPAGRAELSLGNKAEPSRVLWV